MGDIPIMILLILTCADTPVYEALAFDANIKLRHLLTDEVSELPKATLKERGFRPIDSAVWDETPMAKSEYWQHAMGRYQKKWYTKAPAATA